MARSGAGSGLPSAFKGAAAVETAFNCLREQVAYYAEDRFFAPDIKAASDLIQNGELAAVVKLPHILSEV